MNKHITNPVNWNLANYVTSYTSHKSRSYNNYISMNTSIEKNLLTGALILTFSSFINAIKTTYDTVLLNDNFTYNNVLDLVQDVADFGIRNKMIDPYSFAVITTVNVAYKEHVYGGKAAQDSITDAFMNFFSGLSFYAMINKEWSYLGRIGAGIAYVLSEETVILSSCDVAAIKVVNNNKILESMVKEYDCEAESYFCVKGKTNYNKIIQELCPSKEDHRYYLYKGSNFCDALEDVSTIGDIYNPQG